MGGFIPMWYFIGYDSVITLYLNKFSNLAVGILFNFLSSFLLGAGAGLVLALVLAFTARQVFNIDWIKNTLLAAVLFIFATFQIILLFSAYTAKDYVDQAYSVVTTTQEYVDIDALVSQLPALKDYIPEEIYEEYLDEETLQTVNDATDGLLDASALASGAKDTAVQASLGIINAVNDTINSYIVRRWIWLIAEVAVFFVLAALMRRKTPRYDEVDMFAGADGSSTTTMNF